ncbi:UPF0149 family protein [Neisseria leonii]|uniref:UPF0149 family protein n=1 Tax=Neisseria leonii TaxID=2995413 RepID=A0A9X4E0W5_9NEIS|nr:UPF0149 family protein [Neisseria sp. 51.81]MDD9327366.1 UPF0149 family protein [Neisseria sp. 51.81]
METQKIERLAALIDPYATESAGVRSDEVQAMLAALVSGPDDFDLAWLDGFFDETDMPDAERAEAAALVQEWADSIRTELADGRIPELHLLPSETGGADYEVWSNAYLYALDLTETDWFAAADNEEFEDLFYPMMLLAGVFDDEETGIVLDTDEAERTQARQDLPDAVLAVYRFWQAKRNKPATFRRETAKTGRNDACPCGSGKKYKACCGRH